MGVLGGSGLVHPIARGSARGGNAPAGMHSVHARADVHMAWSASMQEHLMNKCRADNSLHN